jgi:hypothetical protein
MALNIIIQIRMKKIRPVYNQAFYVVEAILKSEKFQGIYAEYQGALHSKHLDIPLNGFTSPDEYEKWQTKSTLEKLSPHTFIHGVIRAFKVSGEVRTSVLIALRWKLFFKQDEPHTKAPKFYFSENYDETKRTLDILVRVYEWTTKEDLEDLWKFIESAKKEKTDWVKQKNKKWESIDRDLAIYLLYLKLSNDENKPIKDLYQKLINSDDYKKIVETYSIPDPEDYLYLSKIVSICKSKLGYLSLV